MPTPLAYTQIVEELMRKVQDGTISCLEYCQVDEHMATNKTIDNVLTR
jgi:hypothetical protein